MRHVMEYLQRWAETISVFYFFRFILEWVPISLKSLFHTSPTFSFKYVKLNDIWKQ